MTDPAATLRAVCALFGVSEADLIGRRRSRRLTPARQAAAYALRRAGLSLVEVGELLRRDHTTIIYSVRQAEARATTDPAYAAKLHQLLGEPPAPPPPVRKVVVITPQLRLWLWSHRDSIMMPSAA